MLLQLLRYASLIVLGSCCFGSKDDSLGNNFIPSEYDEVDRRILYSKEKCAASAIEIVPMTVEEYAFDAKWIIAKSSENKYWIISKQLNETSMNKEVNYDYIKSHVFGSFDSSNRFEKANRYD